MMKYKCMFFSKDSHLEHKCRQEQQCQTVCKNLTQEIIASLTIRLDMEQ